jgi:hypothetical protein
MALKHGLVKGSSYFRPDGDRSVQKHMDEHVRDGWTLVDHSIAIAVDPISNATNVVYSFIWQREAMDQ